MCRDGVIEIFGGFGEDVEDGLESFGTVVIWVGDMVEAGISSEKRCHGEYFALSFDRGRDGTQPRQVGVVHAYDDVEIEEVGFVSLPATVRELDAATACMGAHAAVGEVAHMIIARAGRVYDPSCGIGMTCKHIEHEPFGSRTTAYIAKAYEEYANLAWIFNRSDSLTDGCGVGVSEDVHLFLCIGMG